MSRGCLAPACRCESPCEAWGADPEADQAALEREAELDRDDVDDPLDWPAVDDELDPTCGFPACGCATPCALWVGVFGDPEIDELLRDIDALPPSSR